MVIFFNTEEDVAVTVSEDVVGFDTNEQKEIDDQALRDSAGDEEMYGDGWDD